MIAAATNLTSGKMLFNWFDVALVLTLMFGFWRGRKNGMSREFLKVTKWIFIVFAGGLGNEWLGNYLIQFNLIRPFFGKNFSEYTAACVSAYLLIAGTIWLVFVFINSKFRKKLEGSNTFGSGEYYLGITCGVIRFACITTFALSLLNAPVYTHAEIAAKEAYRNRWYGGGLKEFKGDYIPSLDEVQAAAFRDSLLGPSVKSALMPLLINAAPSTTHKSPVVEIQH
jgi:uncharacterized membrane protein required for colicin V production